MTIAHVNELLAEVFGTDERPRAALPLPVGAAFVDPGLIEPRDEQDQQEVEDLIAFRCSTL